MAGRRETVARLFFVLALLALATGSPAFAEGGRTAFSAGVEAARDGDYALALALLEDARAEGLDTPALHFNLGVVLHRLGRTAEAEHELLQAYRSPRMAAPAAYNLGQIARARGDEREAERWFHRALDEARTEAMRERALTALRGLERPPPRTFALITAGAGYDSNVALAPDDIAGVSRESDLFLSIDGFINHLLDDGFHVFGSLYAEEYFDESDYDFHALQGGFGWRGDPGDSRPDARISLRQRYFGGDTYDRALIADAGVTQPAGDGDVRLGVGADYMQGGSGFGYLDGYRLRTGVRWRFPATAGRWTLRANAEHVDRDDLEGEAFFSSLSYDALGLRAAFRRGLGAGRILHLHAGWRSVRYHDAEVRDGENLGRRRDTPVSAGAGIEWPLWPDWRLLTELDGTRRSSNIDAFEYEQVRFLVAIQREF